jgi:hypothetical protein
MTTLSFSFTISLSFSLLGGKTLGRGNTSPSLFLALFFSHMAGGM